MFELCAATCQQFKINFAFYDELDSTNSKALALLQQKPSIWHLVIAAKQSKGRGRRGKNWHSPANSNLYFSLALKVNAKQQTALSLTVGLSLLEILQNLTNLNKPQLGLKWPNDVLLDDKKIAGILLEATSSNLCVIGIGVNVNMTDAQISQDWSSLNLSCGKSFDLDLIATKLITQLQQNITVHLAQGFAPFKAKWLQFHLWQDLEVMAIGAEQTICGVATDLTNNGELVLSTKNGAKIINSGEVSLRRL